MEMPESVYPCSDCGKVYNHDILDRCPGCAREDDPNSTPAKNSRGNKSIQIQRVESSDSNAEMITLLKKQIEVTWGVKTVITNLFLLIVQTTIFMTLSAVSWTIVVLINTTGDSSLAVLPTFFAVVFSIITLILPFFANGTKRMQAENKNQLDKFLKSRN